MQNNMPQMKVPFFTTQAEKQHRQAPVFPADLPIEIEKPFLKMDVSIQALPLLQYFIRRLAISTFLKQRGFAYFPMISGSSLWEPSALAHSTIDRRFFFFF